MGGSRAQGALLDPKSLQFVVSYKRLDRRTFRLPEVEGGTTSVAIDERALDDLLDGIDVETKRKSAPLVRTH